MKKLIACLLIAAFAALAEQQPPFLTAPAFSVQDIKPERPADSQANPPVQLPPKPKAASPSKKKWIAIGAVAAGATVAVLLVNKRLGNEGSSIFGR